MGDDVCIGEKSTILPSLTQKTPTNIGSNVSVGIGVTIESCIVENDCFIGDKSIIHSDSKIGQGSILYPGSVVPPKTIVPKGQVWGGSPAKYIRDISLNDDSSNKKYALEKLKQALLHAKESNKSWLMIEEDEFNYEQSSQRSSYYYKRLNDEVNYLLTIYHLAYINIYYWFTRKWPINLEKKIIILFLVVFSIPL